MCDIKLKDAEEGNMPAELCCKDTNKPTSTPTKKQQIVKEYTMCMLKCQAQIRNKC